MRPLARVSGDSPSVVPPPPRLQFFVAAEAAHLLRARERVRDYMTQHCSDSAVVCDVVAAIDEACANAVRHSGSVEEIEISLAFEGYDLRATIKDHGDGFDVDAFDADAVPDLDLDHGRGLFLMSRLCDEMELRCDGGLEVSLAKRAVLQGSLPLGDIDDALVPTGRTPADAKLRTRVMLDEIGEGFIAIDWDYRCIYVNRGACALFGRAEAEILGRTPGELWPEIAGGDLERAYRAAIELGRPAIVEHETDAGEWLEVRVYPTTVGASVYYREISERKRIESERDALLDSFRRQSEELRGLYEQQRDIATALQANFLHPLPEAAGWEFGVAWRSPAAAAQLVGGDFHDVYLLPGNRVLVMLGDVEGRGIGAAGMTETVHVAARTLAISTPSPRFVLERLNHTLMDESRIVTALLVVLQRTSGTLTLSSAGHLAPLHLRCDGAATPLPVMPGLPLGAFADSDYDMLTGRLRSGEALVLFTDGVIDARRGSAFFGEQGALAAVESLAGGSAQAIADGLCEAVEAFADRLRDDVHVLVVRRSAG